MVNIEEEVFDLISLYAGTPLFSRKLKLSLATDLDTDLHLGKEEAEELMNHFFKKFNVKPMKFDINIYYPEESSHFLSDFLAIFLPSPKYTSIPVPDFTIAMLIESAKAGHWLYD